MPGKRRCFDAIVIKQVGERSVGTRLRGSCNWHPSVAFCRACRSIPTMHVRVDSRTPASLWSSRRTPTQPNPHSSRAGWSSRVPVVRAYSLTWGLTTCVLVDTADSELWAWSERLELQGLVSSASLRWVMWPRWLKQLVLNTSLEGSVKAMRWSPSLQILAFGRWFNQPVTGVAWPPPLQHLFFGNGFD